MTAFHKLATVSPAGIAAIACSEQAHTHQINAPATEVFTDFELHKPLMLEQGTPIDEAIAIMRRTHVKQFLIIDSEEEFRGIICLSDLLSLKVGEAAAATGLRREDLTVLNVMTARQELRAIDMRTLCSASIGDVLETMQTYGHRHVLVVDQAGGRLRGIVSAADIADALHMPVTIESRANTFADIFRTVKH